MAGAVPVVAMAATVVNIEAGARIIEAVIPAIARPAIIAAIAIAIDVAVKAAAAIDSVAVIAVVDTSAERQRRASQRQQRKRPAKPPPAHAVACHLSLHRGGVAWRNHCISWA
jgi:hypothetical protein